MLRVRVRVRVRVRITTGETSFATVLDATPRPAGTCVMVGEPDSSTIYPGSLPLPDEID